MRRYIFADESGNFDFKTGNGASRYFAVGTVTIDGDHARSELNRKLSDLKYDMANRGVPVDGWFHATTDKQAVRDEVFKLLVAEGVHVDVTVLDKRKAMPRIRQTDEQFYKYAWHFHFNKIQWDLAGVTELVVVGASLGTKKRVTAFRAAIEDVVGQRLPATIARRVVSWRDEADHCLQAADYMLWAVTRDIEQNDDRARKQIDGHVSSCFQPFLYGPTLYY